MSDVLIKRMEMPKNCSECKFFAWKRGVGQHCAVDDRITFHATLNGFDVGYERNGNCPLVSVPPHGDLIDRDMLEVQDGWLRDSKYFSQDSGHTHITFVYSNDICNAPIIIEAEEGE